MASKSTKGTGFKAPTIGVRHPAGSTIKRNKDGTVSIVSPKKSKRG